MSGRSHVLVVDDEPLIVDVLRDLFERQGLLVSTAANGLEAMRLLSTGSFDAVLTDLNMPGCGGAELVAAIRQRDAPLLPVIVLTADDWAAQDLATLGDIQILRKPAGITDILAALGRALE
ncbi:MAG: response regulator [Magnetospirillum sp.]|nr:response regulator [Magnetospirillum sp.]